MCPDLKQDPHPRTMATLNWVFGNAHNDCDYMILALLGSLSGLITGSLIVLLFPPIVGILLLIFLAIGLLWLVRVLASYGWSKSWE